jgi:hypothetical protein
MIQEALRQYARRYQEAFNASDTNMLRMLSAQMILAVMTVIYAPKTPALMVTVRITLFLSMWEPTAQREKSAMRAALVLQQRDVLRLKMRAHVDQADVLGHVFFQPLRDNA